MRFAPASTCSLPTRAKGTQIARVRVHQSCPRSETATDRRRCARSPAWFRCERWRDVAGDAGEVGGTTWVACRRMRLVAAAAVWAEVMSCGSGEDSDTVRAGVLPRTKRLEVAVAFRGY